VANKSLANDKTKEPEQQYIFVPATNDQINMQNAFRAKNPFVVHNVRYEHMSKFINYCNQHQTSKGSFPNRDEQHAILIKITATRDF